MEHKGVRKGLDACALPHRETPSEGGMVVDNRPPTATTPPRNGRRGLVPRKLTVSKVASNDAFVACPDVLT